MMAGWREAYATRGAQVHNELQALQAAGDLEVVDAEQLLALEEEPVEEEEEEEEEEELADHLSAATPTEAAGSTM